MTIKCVKCGKMYDEEKYYGICPKCGRYNREESAGEKEHQEMHKKYDDGYSHTENDDHHRFHKEYDNSYSHTETQKDVTAPVQPTSIPSHPMQQKAPQTSGQRTVNRVVKIFLFIILLQFVVQIIFMVIGMFWWI